MPEIWFPNLGIKIDHLSRTAIKIGNFNIYWYGLIIGAAIILATLLVIHEAKRSGQRPEDYIDFASFAIVLSVIGARLYYVIFSWDMYKNICLQRRRSCHIRRCSDRYIVRHNICQKAWN